MVFAYLDPGSGSLILQAVLGGVAGVGVAAKAFRNRLRARKATEVNEDPSKRTSVEVAENPTPPAEP